MPRYSNKQIAENREKHLQEIKSKCEIYPFEEPKNIYECSYISWNIIDGSTKKEKGTIDVKSTHEDTAKDVARDKLYKLLNARPGTILVVASRLIGKVD